MVNLTVFTTPQNELTEDESIYLQACAKTLFAGDRLYRPDGDEHVFWCLVNVLHLLDKHYSEKGGTAISYLEIIRDDSGIGVAILSPDNSPEDTDQ